MPARDPRENPQPGDIVCTATGKRRTVVSRRGGDIAYHDKILTRRTCWITTWQNWCRRNSVTATTADGEKA